MARFTRFVIAAAVSMAFAAPSWAQSLDEAQSLYDAGDYDAAFNSYSALVAEGDPEAMYVIGQMYESGQGTPQNFSSAMRWYRRAAKQDHAQAYFDIGRMFENSIGVPRDFGAAFDAYSAAADLGHAEAELKQAEFFARGRGTGPDVARAAQLLGAAADAGNEDAFEALVDLWDTGEVPTGVLNDDIIARMESVLAARAALGSLVEYGDETGDESETAAYLRQQISTAMQDLDGMLRETSGELSYVLDVSENAEGQITAALRSVSAFGPDGSWDVGDIVMQLAPVDDDSYAVVVTLPERTTFYDSSGNEIGGTSIGSQSFSGVFMPAITTWTTGSGIYADLAMWIEAPGEVSFRLETDSVVLDIQLDETQENKWSGPGSFVMTGMESSLDGQRVLGLESITGAFDCRAIDLGFFNQMNLVMQDIQRKMLEEPEPSEALMAEMQEVGATLVALARERAPLLEGVLMSFEVTDLFGRAPSTGETFSFDSLSMAFGLDDLDKELGGMLFTYAHSGMVVPVPGPNADLVPHAVELHLELGNLPASDAATMTLEMLEGAIADSEAFESQAEMALGFMALGLQQRMVQTGSSFDIKTFIYESPALSATMTGRLVASADSSLMTVGTARLEVVGLEALAKRMDAMAQQGDPDAMDTALGLAMIQAMGARIEQAGEVRHVYDLELTPDGRTLLNGNDMSAMIGGMMAP